MYFDLSKILKQGGGGGALDPPLPMPLHMHEALENVAGKHHNNNLCYTYIYMYTHWIHMQE